MANPRSERLGGVAGIAFVALTVAAYAVAGPYPATDDPVREIAGFFADERGRVLAGLYLQALSVPFFVWFLGTLRAVLRRAEGELGEASAVAVVGGSVLAALALVTTAVYAALAFEPPSPSAVRALFDVGNLLVVFSSFATAAFVAGASAAMLRTGQLGHRPGYAGLAVAAVQLLSGASLAASGWFSPTGVVPIAAFVLFLAWTLATSAVMARAPSAPG